MTSSELRVLITARDESTRAFKSTSAALQKLGVDQEKANGATKAAWTQGYEAKWLGNAERSLKSLGLTSAQARAQLKAAGADVTKLGQSAETSAGGLSKLSGAFGISAGAIAATAVAAAGAAFVAVGTKSLTMAAAVEESDNLFRVATGGMADAGTAFSEKMQSQFGLVASTVRKDVGVWAVMFKGMGMNDDLALKLSTNLTRLAADMVSLYNIDSQTAFDKLRAGIVGEAEPLRRLGILVNEETVKQYALATGLITAGQEMTANQKVLARYNLILKSTELAQGDLGRTMGSTTNQWRQFERNIELSQIALGEKLLPTANAALVAINKMFAESSQAAAGFADAINAPIRALDEAQVAQARAQGGDAAAEETRQKQLKARDLIGRGAQWIWDTGITLSGIGLVRAAGDAWDRFAEKGRQLSPQYWSAAAQGVDAMGASVSTLGSYASATAEETAALVSMMAALAAQTAATNAQLAAMSGTFNAASIRLDPGTKAASKRVRELEAAVEAAQETSAGGGASSGARAATKAATDAVKSQQEALQGLNDELSTTRNRLQELQNVQLKGMGAMDAQTRGLDKQSKQLRLQQLALYEGGTNRKGDLKGGALKQYNALQLQMDAIARKSEAIGLKKSLTYDDKLAAIKEAATGGPPKEMEYQAALKEAKDQWTQYQKLNKSIEAQEKSLKSAQAALEATQAAMEAVTGAGTAINENLKKMQKELEQARRDQALLADAHKDAHSAIDDQATAIDKLGPKATYWADQMRKAGEQALEQLRLYGAGIITEQTKDLEKMVENTRDYYAELQLMARNAANNPTPGSGPTPSLGSSLMPSFPTPRPRASGGPVRAGHLYLVGERGPEPFVPKVDGTILPNSTLRSAGGGVSGGSGGVSVRISFGNVTISNGADIETLANTVADRVRSTLDGDVSAIIRQRPRRELGFSVG